MSAIEVHFRFFQQQRANPRSVQRFQSTAGILFGKPEPLIPARVSGDASQLVRSGEDLEPGREPTRVPVQRATRVSRGVTPTAPGARCVRCQPRGALPKAELQPVPDGTAAPARRGRRRLGLGRRGLLVGQSHGEGELGGLRLPEAGQEVRGDVLGPGAGAAAPLGLAALVERHVPRAARARAAVHGRGVRVVAVLLEALPEMAVHREAGLRAHRGHCSPRPRATCPPPPAPAASAISHRQALRSGWGHGAPTLRVTGTPLLGKPPVQ